jgi:hypothetical protein
MRDPRPARVPKKPKKLKGHELELELEMPSAAKAVAVPQLWDHGGAYHRSVHYCHLIGYPGDHAGHIVPRCREDKRNGVGLQCVG